MRKFLQRILKKPVIRLSNKYASNPDKQRIFSALSDLLKRIQNGEKKKGLVIPFDISTGKYIIFSDQHKGRRNGADDFAYCEQNYLAALDYYYQNGFHLIALGDCEELWENSLSSVKKEHSASFEKEKQFAPKNAFIKIFGNHDLHWANDPLAPFQLKEIYGLEVPVYEGVVLETHIGEKKIIIFCTHGHQGDAVSDGNWLTKFFVAKIWAPFQAFLHINPNTPAYDAQLKTIHNHIMYEWSKEQQNLLLITGHTHQPVFESLTHLERLYRELLGTRTQKDDEKMANIQHEIKTRNFPYTDISEDYLSMKPNYFNSGCCCFDDGDITGIEIVEGCIRLIEWKKKDGKPVRLVLEETHLKELAESINKN